MGNEKELQERIQRLEEELARKDQDLKIYRQELAGANKQLEQLIVQVHDQLQQAHAIQKYLVPTEFPNIQGFDFSTKFKPSSVSGGDYFDIFEHHDKMRFGIFLSSASGYGMSALFLSVLMKMTFEIEDRKSRDPTQVMKEIIAELKTQSKESDQSAVFYGVFDRRKFQLTYSNVGQPLCIYHQASTNKIELLEGSPTPFSLENAKLEQSLQNRVVDLEPKDKLIFCSSGFLNLKNVDEETWGLEEILSIVKKNINSDVHALRNEIFYQASQFSSEQTKDLTALVIEVKDRIIKLA